MDGNRAGQISHATAGAMPTESQGDHEIADLLRHRASSLLNMVRSLPPDLRREVLAELRNKILDECAQIKDIP